MLNKNIVSYNDNPNTIGAPVAYLVKRWPTDLRAVPGSSPVYLYD